MRFLLESKADFMELLRESKRRGVRTEDLFVITPDSHLVNPVSFINQWFKINGVQQDKSQMLKLHRAVTLGRTEHERTIMGYLDSLGTREKYPKIPPANIINGRADGKHRAYLAYLLGIDLPVIVHK